MTVYVAFAAQKDSANQIFTSQLFANQNDGARQTFFATMTAQLHACLCLSDLGPRSPNGLARLAIIYFSTATKTMLKAS